MFPYSTLLNPLFWMIMGALNVVLVLALKAWFKDLGLNMNAWKWLVICFWLLCVYLVIAGGFTLIGENEVRAGLFFLGGGCFLMFVSGVGLWRLLNAK